MDSIDFTGGFKFVSYGGFDLLSPLLLLAFVGPWALYIDGEKKIYIVVDGVDDIICFSLTWIAAPLKSKMREK